MKRKIYVFTGIFIMALLCSGCVVSEDKYMKKSAEADNLTKELAAQQEKKQGAC